MTHTARGRKGRDKVKDVKDVRYERDKKSENPKTNVIFCHSKKFGTNLIESRILP